MFDGVGKVLFFNADHITLESNIVTHNLDQWSCGFRFEGGVSDVLIRYNTIYNNTGPGICVDAHGFTGDNTRFVVNYNNLFNNDTAYGVKYSLAVDGDAYAGTFDARYNWWARPAARPGKVPAPAIWRGATASTGHPPRAGRPSPAAS